MFGLLIFWATSKLHHPTVAIVEVDYPGFDAVYVPPDYSGPIVAIPADEIYFIQEVK
jgi:hypothetical protein